VAAKVRNAWRLSSMKTGARRYPTQGRNVLSPENRQNLVKKFLK
jgi:hypothetical protein